MDTRSKYIVMEIIELALSSHTEFPENEIKLKK